jgi:hypothetical protein
MNKLARAVVVCVAIAVCSPASAHAAHWHAGQCGLPATAPLYAEYAEIAVSPTIRNDIFAIARPPLVLATSGPGLGAELRAAGARTVYWQMKIERMLGYTNAPADPATIATAAQRLLDRAAATSGCATPLIALNELQGAWLPTPWSPTNAQYRANALELLRQLHRRGARPFLLVPTSPRPFTDSPEAIAWWQQVALVADVVLQVHFNGRVLHRQGAILGSRLRRSAIRRALTQFVAIGIPAPRLGILHGFQSGRGFGGREGLRLAKWLRVVKWEALAAKQVAGEQAADGSPLGSIWSWGWGDFPTLSFHDPDKPVTACVYLWTRHPAFCPALRWAKVWGVGFNTSRSEGQILLPPDVQCVVGRRPRWITTASIDALAAVTGDPPLGPVGRTNASAAVFARLLQLPRAEVEAADVLRAEEQLVATTFGGNRAAYEAALAARRATVEIARGVIADQLRQQKLARTLGAGRTLYAWTKDRQVNALSTAICRRDALPATGLVDLTAYLPFLRLPR